jgi:hypothetical protein
MRQIEHAPNVPPYFDSDALEQTRRLSNLTGKDVQGIVFSAPGEADVLVTQRAAANVDDLTQTAPHPHFENSSITGILEQVTYAPGKPKFRLRRTASGLAVDCTFEPDQLEAVKSELPHRVRVYGETKYNRVGDPISIKVESIERLPEGKAPVQFDDLRGIDITSGEDAADYVGRLRGDDEAA